MKNKYYSWYPPDYGSQSRGTRIGLEEAQDLASHASSLGEAKEKFLIGYHLYTTPQKEKTKTQKPRKLNSEFKR